MCDDGSDCRALTENMHQLGIECSEVKDSHAFGAKKQPLLQYCPGACAGKPCKKGALVGTAGVNHICTCKPGFHGKGCEVQICRDDIAWRSVDGMGAACSLYGKFMHAFCAQHKGTGGRTATDACLKSCGNCTAVGASPCEPNPCFRGKCSETTATEYKCTCESQWGGAKCELQQELLQQNTFRQCQQNMVQPTLKIPVDTAVSTVTIGTFNDQTLNSCHRAFVTPARSQFHLSLIRGTSSIFRSILIARYISSKDGIFQLVP